MKCWLKGSCSPLSFDLNASCNNSRVSARQNAVKFVLQLLQKENSMHLACISPCIVQVETMLATLGCFTLAEAPQMKGKFGDVVAKRTVVYYGRAGDKRAAM